MLAKLKQFLGMQAPGETVRWIDCADLVARIPTRNPAMIDVRGPDEFDGPLGHIDGAVNLPVDAIVAGTADVARFRGRDVVLVCRTDKPSARAADSLKASGFTRVSVLRGGMESWNAAGLPVVRGSAEP
jgi:rhodanese-related sulfurtransferase